MASQLPLGDKSEGASGLFLDLEISLHLIKFYQAVSFPVKLVTNITTKLIKGWD